MGYKYVLSKEFSHKDTKAHAFIDLVAGKGKTASILRTADLGVINCADPGYMAKLHNYEELIRNLNNDLATFKTTYEGPRKITGEKLYSSIIVSSILYSLIHVFSAYDILISREADALFLLLVSNEVFDLGTFLEDTGNLLYTYPISPIVDRDKCISELLANSKTILYLIDTFSEMHTERSLTENIYGRTVNEIDIPYAEDMLFYKGRVTGWDRYNETVFLDHTGTYGVKITINTLVTAASTLIYHVISEKTGLRPKRVRELLSNEQKRIVYDESVSFASEKPSRDMTRIYNAFNTIPDKYERLDDSIRTMNILIANL